jgi:hypothetical protein
MVAAPDPTAKHRFRFRRFRIVPGVSNGYPAHKQSFTAPSENFLRTAVKRHIITFMSCAHTDADIDLALEAADAGFRHVTR